MTTWNTCRDKLRKQAYRNALTLFLMSAMFVVTWVIMVALYLIGGRP